ncbi:MAG: response regulator transcription factor [Rhodothermaceae bacterium]
MKKNKILLAEDDQNLGTILQDFLEIKNYDVTLAVNGEKAFEVFQTQNFDMCVFDVMMPKLDGFNLTKKIRETGNEIPIIFLTAKSMSQDKIEGFKVGADDYITKPFNTEELLLRITAIMRRLNKSGETTAEPDEFKIGKYLFNAKKRTLTIDKNSQKLTSKENSLLKLLCLKKNDILERSIALKTIWKEDNYFTSRSMDVYIAKLRNYLKDDASIEIINIHGSGFKLQDE